MGTSEVPLLLTLLLLPTGSGQALGLGLGAQMNPTGHVPPRLRHLLSKRDGAREQPLLHLQLGSVVTRSITARDFPVGRWEEVWFNVTTCPTWGREALV